MTNKPEAWLRGPIHGVDPIVQPIVFALTQVVEDLRDKIPDLSDEQLWYKPGGAASVGFHLRHLAGSSDRLISYASGVQLTPDQRTALTREKEDSDEGCTELIAAASTVIERAIRIVAKTSGEELFVVRAVGSAQLPSTVLGLYSHCAEHAARHMGQVITTAKIVLSNDSLFPE